MDREKLEDIIYRWEYDYGVEYMLNEMVHSMSTQELYEFAEYFARCHDEPFDEEEEEE